uniref:Uncharacterized protein n=1 Tax=Eutreptiella gymnastica TaxID=73025 RepID=A0A7S4LDH8_9EUGL
MCILVSTVWLTGSVPVCEEQLIRLQRSLHRLPFNITPIVAIKHNAAELKIVVKGIHDCSATVRTNSVISEIQLRQRTVPFQSRLQPLYLLPPIPPSASSPFHERSNCVSVLFRSSAAATASPPSAPSALSERSNCVSVLFRSSAAATALPPSAPS